MYMYYAQITHILCHCRHLTAAPHIAGSEENHMLAQDIYNQWIGFNAFDNVNLMNYSVLLSYPNTSNPNLLQLMQGSEVIYTAHIDQEPPLTPGENDSRVVPPFNAYSGSGTASVSHIHDFVQCTCTIPYRCQSQ